MMKYLKTMLGQIFSRSFLWNVCGRQDRDFDKLARSTSFIDESTALPRLDQKFIIVPSESQTMKDI